MKAIARLAIASLVVAFVASVPSYVSASPTCSASGGVTGQVEVGARFMGRYVVQNNASAYTEAGARIGSVPKGTVVIGAGRRILCLANERATVWLIQTDWGFISEGSLARG